MSQNEPPSVRGRRHKLSETTRQRVARLVSRSVAYRTPAARIAVRFGISRATVYRLLRSAGLTRNRRQVRRPFGGALRFRHEVRLSVLQGWESADESDPVGSMRVRWFTGSERRVIVRPPQPGSLVRRGDRDLPGGEPLPHYPLRNHSWLPNGSFRFYRAKRLPPIPPKTWLALLARESTITTLKRLREEGAARRVDRMTPPPSVLFSGLKPRNQTKH